MELTEPVPPAMPDFKLPRWGFRHTLYSAVASLVTLGVPDDRIMISMAGIGLAEGAVVDQFPEPGAALTPDVIAQLEIAGPGFFHRLPSGMWHEGVQEVVGVFDDPIQRMKYLLSEGMGLYVVDADDIKACARWIRLFGLVPEEWPEEIWYRLAVILPSLHRLAGTEAGIRLSLDLLLDLPLQELRRRPSYLPFGKEDISRLGLSAHRLGVDYALGSGKEDLAEIQLALGPVSLGKWKEFQTGPLQVRLAAVLALCTPYHQRYSVSWLVMDPNAAPRLGEEAANARLGVNSHLGWSPTAPTQLRPRETDYEPR